MRQITFFTAAVIGATLFAGQAEAWPWPSTPEEKVRAAAFKLERLDARLVVEEAAARRADQAVRRAEDDLQHAKKWRRGGRIIGQCDAAVTYHERVALARREAVRSTKAERDVAIEESEKSIAAAARAKTGRR